MACIPFIYFLLYLRTPFKMTWRDTTRASGGGGEPTNQQSWSPSTHKKAHYKKKTEYRHRQINLERTQSINQSAN